MERTTDEQVHVIRLDKAGEHYVFMYTRQYRAQMMLQVVRWAMNPELSFSWYDAARISKEVRNW